VPYAVGLVISAGYWFTSSTSFANPAVTVARTFTNTFSGIRPDDAGMFIAAQLIGAVVVTYLFAWLLDTRGAGVRDNRVLISEGITAGDIVAVAGVSFLRDGQKVKLLSE